MNPKILIIEEESIIALELKIVLESFGFEKIEAICNTENLENKIRSFEPDLILSELYFCKPVDIVQILSSLLKERQFHVIFVTALQYLIDDPKIKSVKPYAIIGKPFGMVELRETLQKLYPQFLAAN